MCMKCIRTTSSLTREKVVIDQTEPMLDDEQLSEL